MKNNNCPICKNILTIYVVDKKRFTLDGIYKECNYCHKVYSIHDNKLIETHFPEPLTKELWNEYIERKRTLNEPRPVCPCLICDEIYKTKKMVRQS